MKKIILLIICMILLIGNISAFEFDNVKSYDKEQEKITIYNWNFIGKIFDLKLAEYTLIKNTDQCLTNCKAKGTSTLYSDGKLFSDLRFKGIDNKFKDIISSKIFIEVIEDYQEEVIDYKEVCSDKVLNGTLTNVCIKEESGTHNEIKTKTYWKEYNFESLKGNETGITYEWEIEGIKKPLESIDWIGSAFGKDFTEWAWWNADFNRCRNMNITGGASSLTNFPFYVNVTYDVDMQTDFDDLRFVNKACNDGGSEMDYEIDFKFDSNSAGVWISAPTLATGTNEFSMYYDNSGASSGENPVSLWDNAGVVHVYHFSSASGTNAKDSSSSSNNVTFTGGVSWVSNENTTYGYGVSFDGVNDKGISINPIDSTIRGRNNRTINFIGVYQKLAGNPGSPFFVTFRAASGNYMSFGVDTGTNNWYIEGATTFISDSPIPKNLAKNFHNINDYQTLIWSINKTSLVPGATNTNLPADTELRLAVGQASDNWAKITLDELRLYNRTVLSAEINRTYDNNDFSLFTFGSEEENTGVSTTLLIPINNANSTSTTIDFLVNSTSRGITNLTNVTLYIWYSNTTLLLTNFTSLSGSETITTNWSIVNIPEGNFIWNALTKGLSDTSDWGSNRTFEVDITPPLINVTFPNETIIFHKKDTNLNLNWTVSDALIGLDSCWFNYNSINTIVTCSDNNTNFNVTTGLVKELTFFANDTLNNIANQTVSWNYRLFLNSETFDAETIEGIETTFSINILTNGSAITSANLRYNNIDNVGSIANPTTNNFTLSKTITTPSVNTETNISFFWNISQGTVTHSLDVKNQTVSDLAIDDCSANSNLIYNFTIMNEKTKVKLNGIGLNTIGKINFRLLNFQSTLITEFNNEFSQTNPFNICLSSNLSEISINLIHDFEIQYSADGFQSELYNVQNQTINSTSLNQSINLLDLNTSNAQVFKIIFRDSAFLPIENALIKIQRKYIDLGIFNITEIPKTDERGETVASFVINNVIYKIEVIKFGKTLLIVNNVIAKCQTPLVSQCIIDLNAFSDTITIPNFKTVDNFNFTISYDNNTRTISSTFLILNGDVQTVSLNVTRQDALGTAVCTDISISSSGTLSCVVPSSFGNSTITAKLFVDGNLKGTGSVKQDQDPSEIYGATLIGLGIFIMLSLIGTSISNNPVFTTVFLILGVIMLFALNLVDNNGFIGAGATILWMIIAVMLLIIKGARRN